MEHLKQNVKDQVNFRSKKPSNKTDHKTAASINRQKNTPNNSKENMELKRIRELVREQRKKTTKKPPPTRVVIGSLIFLAILVATNLFYEDAMRFAQKLDIQVNAVPVSNAEEGLVEKSLKKEKKTTLSPREKKSWTEEEIKIFQGLEERKVELDAKENNLKALEAELMEQKKRIDEKLAKIEGLREEISVALSSEVAEDKKKITKLVDVYSSMKPDLAAKLMVEVDEKLAIEILAEMKKDNAADILNFIEPEKARRLSEKYVGYMNKYK